MQNARHTRQPTSMRRIYIINDRCKNFTVAQQKTLVEHRIQRPFRRGFRAFASGIDARWNAYTVFGVGAEFPWCRSMPLPADVGNFRNDIDSWLINFIRNHSNLRHIFVSTSFDASPSWDSSWMIALHFNICNCDFRTTVCTTAAGIFIIFGSSLHSGSAFSSAFFPVYCDKTSIGQLLEFSVSASSSLLR